jgi:hypothetical protein
MLYSVFKQGVSSKPQFIQYESKLPISTRDLDYYISLFQYSKEQKELAETRGSLAGLKDVSTSILYFDFDSKDNLEVARKDAIKLAERLIDAKVDPEQIKASFTGQKGFSIEVKLSRRISNEEFKAATQKLAGDLETFDHVVSDPNRIIRVDNTKHQKSGNYKIPLTIYDLDELAIKDIINMSVLNTTLNKEFKAVSIPESFFKTPEKKKEKVKLSNDLEEALEKLPKGWKNYKWALASGFFESGERHNALMVIAATCRGLGYDKTTAYYICKSAVEKQSNRSGDDKFPKEELYENIIDQSVYSETWEGGQYSPATNPWLKKYCERMGFEVKKEEETKARRIQDIQDEFKHFVDHIEENTILTGIKRLDQALPITIGMNLGIVGAASSGKTALALEILKNTSKAGVISVFASLDMHRNRLFEKLLYKTTGLSRGDLYAKIKAGEIEEITKKIKEDYANVWFYDRSCPSVADIRDYVEEVEQETGKKVKLVMLDYFERVNSDKSEDTAASKDIAGQLQDLVNDFNVAMVTLVQPNKFSLSSGPDKPIKSYTAIKGSSFLYQSFRSIISIWRPFFTPDTAADDKYLQMAILKNDLGELGLFNFTWEGKRGEIRECTEEEEAQMEYLMEQKAAKEAGNKEDNSWQ